MMKRVEIIDNDPNLAFQDPRTQALLKVLVHRTTKRLPTAQELLNEINERRY